MSSFTRNLTRLPILPTPGLNHPRFTRLRFMTADAGTAGTAAATAVDSDATDSTDPAPTIDPAPQGGKVDDAAAGDSPWNDPTKAQAEIEKLRRENAAARTNAKATAAQEARDSVLQEFGKALGFIKEGDDTPDADALTKAAQDAADEARVARVELAAYKAAGTLGANPVELLDRRSVVTALDKLDPTADDFDAQVVAVVKKAVTDNPQLLAQAPVAGASSTDHPGGSGEVADIDAQIAAAQAAGDNRRAIQLKRQRAQI